MVQAKIRDHLNFKNPKTISDGLERPNLAIKVHEIVGTEEKLEKIFKIIQEKKFQTGSILIYASLIQTVNVISSFLQRKKIEHLVYHGDLKSSQRQENLKIFQQQDSPVMVATPAFGLGIDKPNVRQLFHFEIPGSLEAYFQEIGRAGRDAHLSDIHLLFDEDDLSIQMEFIKWSYPEDAFIRQVYKLIEKNESRIQQEGFEFLREQMNFKNRRDYRAESSVNILERWGCLERSKDHFPFKPAREPEDADFQKEQAQLQFKHQNQKLLDILRWAQASELSSDECRMLGIYKYFGHEGKACGICDLCESQ